jgi:hypothetical protein
VRRALYAMIDLQSGLQEAARYHAAGSKQTARLGVMTALYHFIRFVSVALPTANRLPGEQLLEALAMLDAGAVSPIFEPCPQARRSGAPPRQPAQADLAALVTAAVTFLIDKLGMGERSNLDPACHVVARLANKQGFRDRAGNEFVAPQIRTLRNKLAHETRRSEGRQGSGETRTGVGTSRP